MTESIPAPSSQHTPVTFRLYFVLALVWLASRLYTLSMTVPWSFWEVAEAKKLLDYGFWPRSGAIINVHFMPGVVAEPWRFNYVNHPYPILWLDTLVYLISGPWGVVLLSGLIGLAACLLVVAALRSTVSERLSLIGGVLFALAPSSIIFSFDTNVVQLGAVLWPVAICLIARGFENKGPGAAIALGISVFLFGQVSWFTYSILSVLLIGLVVIPYRGSGRFAAPSKRGLILAVLCGGLLTFAVFATQVVIYNPSYAETVSYLRGQAGPEDGGSLFQMYLAIAMRAMLSIGPALLLGSVVGLVRLARRRALNLVQFVALLYPLVFVAATLALPRFFFRERTMYQYLVFPCTVLTLAALPDRKGAISGVLCLAVLGTAYPLIQSSIPKVSRTSEELGRLIRSISQPTEIIATNLQRQHSPFQQWDVGSIEMTSLAADRMIRDEILSSTDLKRLLKTHITKEMSIVFIYDRALPIGQTLLAGLGNSAEPIQIQFTAPAEPPSLAIKLRSLYWQITRKHQVVEEAADHGSVHQLDVFKFRLSESTLSKFERP